MAQKVLRKDTVLRALKQVGVIDYKWLTKNSKKVFGVNASEADAKLTNMAEEGIVEWDNETNAYTTKEVMNHKVERSQQTDSQQDDLTETMNWFNEQLSLDEQIGGKLLTEEQHDRYTNAFYYLSKLQQFIEDIKI